MVDEGTATIKLQFFPRLDLYPAVKIDYSCLFFLTDYILKRTSSFMGGKACAASVQTASSVFSSVQC